MRVHEDLLEPTIAEQLHHILYITNFKRVFPEVLIMGPKKGGKGGGGLHELDHSVFSREGVDFSNIEGEVEELDVLLSGKLAVVSKLFPEWNIEGENWGAEIPSEELHTTTYPSYISTNGDPVAIKVHLGLEEEAPADPKAKGKKDAKKGAPASDELTEPEKDEDGKPSEDVYPNRQHKE